MKRLFGSRRDTVSYRTPKEAIQTMLFDIKHERLVIITTANKTKVFRLSFPELEVQIPEDVTIIRDGAYIQFKTK